MAEKKATEKKVAAKKTATKTTATKTAAKRCATKKAEVVLNVDAESVGFRAGDVYQALAAAGKALSVQEIAKAAISVAKKFTSVLAGSSRRAR